MQVLVKDQGEVINQIECNVQSANENTEQGVEELKTAVVYQVNKKYIKYYIYIYIYFFFFFFFFCYFLIFNYFFYYLINFFKYNL